MDFQIGDRVKISGQETVGEILLIRGKEAEVVFGLMKSTVKLNRLELVEEEEEEYGAIENTGEMQQQSAFDTKDKLMNFQFQLDLRGKMKDEVLYELQKQLDDAILLGIKEFNILHGRGTGVIKTTVRHEQKNTKRLTAFRMRQGMVAMG
ncbi:MAG: Smr/MutS family protein [Cytophagaceae bacterium]|jgi:DNA mismatch repair protein MutS2|nr:Smr/MutS family protein [Cytophagaceae bacterium]